MKNDTSRKSTRGQRLLQIVECPSSKAQERPHGCPFRRHEDGNVRRPEVALEIPEEIPTIQTADLGIDDHEVGAKLGASATIRVRRECSAIEAEQSERRGPGSLDFVVIEDQHEAVCEWIESRALAIALHVTLPRASSHSMIA